MAVIQISRVQVRRGQTAQTGFPQLASGEFGWSIDQQELYIGNGAVSEGAPAIGNTRILTTKDTNFFLLTSPNYTYSNRPDLGPSVQTGPNDNPYVYRYVQNKLDDTVNLRDFGCVGDGATAETANIQRAINHAAEKKKVLVFPEGIYVITGTIFIPPYTEIRGAGENKTVLTATSVATILQTIDGAGNTGTNISSAAVTPQNVRINGVTFRSPVSSAAPMVKFDCLSDSTLEDCIFIANSAIASTSTMASAIEMTGNSALTCDNISIKDCVFQSLGTAIVSDYDIKNINISDSRFRNIDAGLAFSKNLNWEVGSQVGPTYVTVHNNSFYNVNKEGLFVGTNTTGVSIIKSANNSYVNVGVGYNNTNGDLTQRTDVITFGTLGNFSVDDNFSRIEAINTGTLSPFTSIKPVVAGPAAVRSRLTRRVVIGGVGTYNIYAWPRNAYTVTNVTGAGQTIELDYTLSKTTGTRRGTVVAVVNGNVSNIRDDFTSTGSTDGDITFSVDLTRSDVILLKVTNVGLNGTITFTPNIRQ